MARIYEPWCPICETYWNPQNLQVEEGRVKIGSHTYRFITCGLGHIIGRKEIRRVEFAI